MSAEKGEIEKNLLGALNFEEKTVDSREFAERHNYTHEETVRVIQSLESEEYVVKTLVKGFRLDLTQEALDILQDGSPEFKLYTAVNPDGGSSIADLKSSGVIDARIFGRAQALCCKRKWLAKDGDLLTRVTDQVEDEVKVQLDIVQKEGIDAFGDKANNVKKELQKKRKLLKNIRANTFTISKGPKYLPIPPQRREGQVLLKHIQDGSWKSKNYKPLNLDTLGPRAEFGTLHPLLKVRTEFRHILLEMGFEEMKTNNFVESSFWNFDTLFQPQQHPARDAHDTFFLTNPASGKLALPEYTERVKEMHERGDDESIGWRYDWSYEEASKNLLRTHTTAVSSRMLYKLGQEEKFQPKKYFSIDRVFRNETVDATHLAEFHQVEGLIADYDLTLGDLIGVIAKFFEKIGISDVKFKPAYNPYTEPSMEIFGYSAANGWMEVGNSGIFRPEMLKPMGLPDNVRVIAWGLSLERPTMIKYKIKNIRDLFGPRVELNVVKKNPIARFD